MAKDLLDEMFNKKFMVDHKEDDKTLSSQHKDAALKPEPETLNTPDPQDKMEGPISSLVQGVKEGLEDNETKKESNSEEER